MTKDVWLNLPVKDMKKSKEFFCKLGFSFNPRFGESDAMAALTIGEKNFIIMLFPEGAFKGMAGMTAADTSRGSEMMISIDAESPQEVDGLAKKAEEAGGTVFGKPGEVQGWMYGCGFTDLDGHRWNVLHMDMSKMPR